MARRSLMTIRRAASSAVSAIALLAGACGSAGPAENAVRTVTIYVSTDRVFSEPVLREYERRSGVRVNAVYDTERVEEATVRAATILGL